MMGPDSYVTAEFDRAWRNRTQNHRAHLADAGITFEAMLRAGDLGVERICTTGRLPGATQGRYGEIGLARMFRAESNWATAEQKVSAFITDGEHDG